MGMEQEEALPIPWNLKVILIPIMEKIPGIQPLFPYCLQSHQAHVKAQSRSAPCGLSSHLFREEMTCVFRDGTELKSPSGFTT